MVCVEEVLTNILRHGIRGIPESEMEMHVNLNAGEIEIQVVDDGPAFDPVAYPAPNVDLAVDQRSVGGLGIHFVRNLMDRVSYKRLNDRNWLTMTKRCMNSHEAGAV